MNKRTAYLKSQKLLNFLSNNFWGTLFLGILPAYHMNKEHWITVLLDGTVSKNKI